MPAPTSGNSVLRRAAFASLLLLPGAVAMAQDNSLIAFLQSIYDPYKNKAFKGQPYSEASRFFAPELARAIERDMNDSKKRNEAPLLNGDPFLDAQEWQVTAIAYAASLTADKSKGAGSVAFVNLGEPKGISLTLVSTPQGWRITDIIGPSGSLRALYKLK